MTGDAGAASTTGPRARSAPEAYALLNWPTWHVCPAVYLGLAELVGRGCLAVEPAPRRSLVGRRSGTVGRVAGALAPDAPWPLVSLLDAIAARRARRLAGGGRGVQLDRLHRGLRRAGHGRPVHWGRTLAQGLQAQGLVEAGELRTVPPLTAAGAAERERVGALREEARARLPAGETLRAVDAAGLVPLVNVRPGRPLEELLVVPGLDIAAVGAAWQPLQAATHRYWLLFLVGPDGPDGGARTPEY